MKETENEIREVDRGSPRAFSAMTRWLDFILRAMGTGSTISRRGVIRLDCSLIRRALWQQLR